MGIIFARWAKLDPYNSTVAVVHRNQTSAVSRTTPATTAIKRDIKLRYVAVLCKVRMHNDSQARDNKGLNEGTVTADIRACNLFTVSAEQMAGPPLAVAGHINQVLLQMEMYMKTSVFFISILHWSMVCNATSKTTNFDMENLYILQWGTEYIRLPPPQHYILQSAHTSSSSW